MGFIIPILVGATIGYITNWFAIKMLFRPHEEKRFLGIHIPFTPGLIPKEKGRIARSVGETVGIHLLSPDVVIGSLSKDNMDEYIRAWVESNINILKKENKSVKALIKNFNGEIYSKSLDNMVRRLTDFICFQIKRQEFKQKIMDIIEYYIFNKSKEDIYKILDEKMELFLYELSTSEVTRLGLKNAINIKLEELTGDQRALMEVVPDSIIYMAKDYIKEHDRDIINILKDILNEPSIETRLKGSITNIAAQNMSKVITMFIGPEMISNKVFHMIKEYIDKPEASKNIVLMITAGIDKLLENKIGNIAINISSKISEEEVSKILDIILAYVSNKENHRKFVKIIDENIRVQELKIKDSLLDFISNKFDIILNSEILYDNIYLFILDIADKFINKPISSIVINIDENMIINITELCKTIFDDFISNKLPHIVELFNISKIVEEQINSFDVAFAEELIIEIAHKELKAITWLGAILGGIMGILSPLLQMAQIK